MNAQPSVCVGSVSIGSKAKVGKGRFYPIRLLGLSIRREITSFTNGCEASKVSCGNGTVFPRAKRERDQVVRSGWLRFSDPTVGIHCTLYTSFLTLVAFRSWTFWPFASTRSGLPIARLALAAGKYRHERIMYLLHWPLWLCYMRSDN